MRELSKDVSIVVPIMIGVNTHNSDESSIGEALLLLYEFVIPYFRKYDTPYCPIENAEEHDADAHDAVPFKTVKFDE